MACTKAVHMMYLSPSVGLSIISFFLLVQLLFVMVKLPSADLNEPHYPVKFSA